MNSDNRCAQTMRDCYTSLMTNAPTTTTYADRVADLADRAENLADLFTRVAADLRRAPRTVAELDAIATSLGNASLAAMSLNAKVVSTRSAVRPFILGDAVRYVGRPPAYVCGAASDLDLRGPRVDGVVDERLPDGRLNVSWNFDGIFFACAPHRPEELARV